MKVLITTTLYTVKTNGVVTSVLNLVEELEKRGHEVRVLTLSEGVHSRIEGSIYFMPSLPFEWVYPGIRMPLHLPKQFKHDLIDWMPDIIHSQCEFFTYKPALKIARRTGAPIVHTYHTMYEQYAAYAIPIESIGKPIVRSYCGRRLKRFDKIIAPTHKVKESLESYGLSVPISIVPTGIDIGKYKHNKPTADERAKKRREIGIPEENSVLLSLGRVGAEKNISELIEFFGKARKRNPNLTLLIVGDGPAREKLEAEVMELGLSDSVIFTGMVKPDEVKSYYAIADLFVSASTSETQGLTYIEAAANALALICRKDSCLTNIIVQGKNGYQYTTEEEFLTFIDSALSDTEWRKSAGALSEKIADCFDKSAFGESIEKIYLHEIAKNAKKSRKVRGNTAKLI